MDSRKNDDLPRMQIEDEEDLELVGSVQSPSSYSLGFKKNFCRGIFALTAVFFILFIIVFSALSLIDPHPLPIELDGFRLPQHIQPKHYDLLINTDLDKFLFNGKVEIYVDSNLTQVDHTLKNSIILHSIGLDITKVELGHEDVVQKPTNISFDEEKEILILRFQELKDKTQYLLTIEFQGTLKDDLRGYYRSSYTDDTGVHWLASTQFEPIDARRSFPCFDEPSMKATFSITLDLNPNLNALSNMPESSTTIVEGKKRVSFDISPLMSTYLVAFVVSDLECIQRKSPVSGNAVAKDIYVCARKDQIDSKAGDYGLDIAANILHFYEGYFDIPFPLPKIHLVAIPDFCCGAMENWGLITYRETALLYNPTIDSAASKQRVATVISHELAHQWFGNLVTMEWWDDLWLNEGFASYMEYLGVASVHPDWMMTWTQFYSMDPAEAMIMDSFLSTHSISATIIDPATISQLFDAISYGKGASVIRMLQAYIDTKSRGDSFSNRITKYLTKHTYSNAITSDLWETLAANDFPEIVPLMESWTKQPGFPYIQITLNGDQMIIFQERFLASPSKQNDETFNQLWMIPFTIQTPSSTSDPILLREKTTLRPFQNNGDWFKINVGQAVPCRVMYPSQVIETLSSKLLDNPSIISDVDRAGLLDDTWSFSNANLINVSDAMILSQYLVKEENPIVWVIALNSLLSVSKKMSESSTSPKMKSFILELMNPILTTYSTWSLPESHVDQLGFIQVLRSAILLGHQETINKALSYFQELITTGSTAAPTELISVVYHAGIQEGDKSTYNLVKERYLESNQASEQYMLLQALTTTKDVDLLRRTLEFAISPDVRSQDSTKVVVWVSSNPLGTILAWEFVKSNWKLFVERYGNGAFNLSNLLFTVVGNLYKPEHLQDAIQFFEQNPLPTASVAINNGLESLESNIEWIDKGLPLIQNWLENN